MKKTILTIAVMQMSLVFAGEIDISGLDKIALIKALYGRAQVQGNGYKQPHRNTLTDGQAESASKGYVDYVNGRVMKIDISGNTVDTFLYNRDNGDNAAEKVINNLRTKL